MSPWWLDGRRELLDVWEGVKRSEDAWVVCSDPVEAQQVEVWSYDAKGDEFALSKHPGNRSARPWSSTYIYHSVRRRV